MKKIIVRIIKYFLICYREAEFQVRADEIRRELLRTKLGMQKKVEYSADIYKDFVDRPKTKIIIDSIYKGGDGDV